MISILPGILMSPDQVAELLAEEREPEDMFKHFWEIGFELEEMMRGGWTADECQAWSVRVARQALPLLFQSRAARHWRSAHCILLQQQDGTMAYPILKGDEAGPVLEVPDSENPAFLAGLNAAKLEAERILALSQPKPRASLVIFIARVGTNQVQMRYEVPLDGATARGETDGHRII